MAKAKSSRKPAAKAMGRFRHLILTTALVTYMLIIIGGIVRVTGSGLGCPDWPTCFGSWIPPMRFDAIIEYTHRLAAALTSPLILASALVAWLRYREHRLISRPLLWGLGLLLVQGLLGGLVVVLETPPNLVAVHLGVALILFALLIVSAVAAFHLYAHGKLPQRLQFRSRFSRSARGALVGIFVVLVSGALVAMTNATYACSGWPLCNGELIPGHPLGWVHMGHRLAVALVSVHLVMLLARAWRTQRTQRGILISATLTVVLYFSQALVGAVKVSSQFPIPLLGLHVASAAAVWAAAVVLAGLVGLADRSPQDEDKEAAQPLDTSQFLKDLLSLTKPIIVALLLVTTYGGMVLAGRALPPLGLTLWTLLGGALAAGGSGAINQYIDRETDQHMSRTARRPIAAGRLTPAEGLAFGLSLLVLAFFLLANFVNLLAALLALAGMVYYVVLYSMWLKHATVQNIVIGGGAGAIPPLVGWAAVAGSLNWTAVFLFLIIFMWTPPHFWALALIKHKDYARAGVPMLPVVRGEAETRRQIWWYSVLLVALTLALPPLGMAGTVYLVSAALLGGLLLLAAWAVLRQGGNKVAWRMYRYSSLYLALLFLALVLDALL
ncbi:MAG: heme o synthase [Anaerolineales bacterium]|nr:heme o synthase [Anaerolineales bacterium]